MRLLIDIKIKLVLSLWLFSRLTSSGDWGSGCQQQKQRFTLALVEPMEGYSHK